MFKGSMPALVTPFANGKVDFKALENLVEWQIAEGSSGIVPVGTTGESPTLSHDEHENVIETVVKAAAGRVPIIAGAGSNNTEEAKRFVRFAEKVGADAVLVVAPYYNKPTPEGLFAHYSAVADASNLPIIVYNIPGRSSVDIKPDLMARLAELPTIIGVKDATADLARVAQQRLQCGADFVQLSGEDATAMGFNAMGGVGCISVTANVAPSLCAQLQAATLAGDYAKAMDVHDRLMPLHEAIFTEPGVVGAKYALSVMGKCQPNVRLPITEALAETKAKLDSALRHAGLMN